MRVDPYAEDYRREPGEGSAEIEEAGAEAPASPTGRSHLGGLSRLHQGTLRPAASWLPRSRLHGRRCGDLPPVAPTADEQAEAAYAEQDHRRRLWGGIPLRARTHQR